MGNCFCKKFTHGTDIRFSTSVQTVDDSEDTEYDSHSVTSMKVDTPKEDDGYAIEVRMTPVDIPPANNAFDSEGFVYM